MPSTPNPVDRTQLGRLLSGQNARIDELEQAAANAGTSQTVGLPIVDSTFAPLYDRSDKKGVKVTLQYANFGAAYDLKIIMVEAAQIVTEADYEQKRIRTSLEDDISEAGRSLQVFAAQMKEILKYNTQYHIIRLVAIGLNGEDRLANPDDAPGGSTGFPGYPGNVLFTFTTPEKYGAPPFPTVTDIDTQLDPDTDGYDAYAIITNICPLHPDTGQAQTYRQANVDWVENVITRDLAGTTGVQEIPEKYLLTDADLDAVVVGGPNNGRGFCKVKYVNLKPGVNYTLTKVLVHSVGDKRSANGSVLFIAGSLTRLLSALTNVAIVFSTTDPFDDGTWVDVALEFTQPWPNPVSLKNVTQDYKNSTATNWTQVLHKDPRPQNDLFHRQVNAGTISIGNGSTSVVGVGTNFTRWEAGWKIKVGAQTLVVAVKPTSDTAATVTTPSGVLVSGSAYTIVMRMPLHRIKVKANRTYNNEIRLLARGNDLLTLSTNVIIGPDGHIANDTGRPATIAAPICQAFIDGNVKVEADVPSDQIHTINKYRFHMSTTNTTPDRDAPAEGVAGVVKLRKAHLYTTFQRPLTDISATTYYFGVQAKNDIGWGEWSPRTSVLGSAIGRPLTDVIGSAVPALPIRLERSATGGTSGNSTTTYVLDGSASAVDNFYVGMHIHIPSLAAANRIRKITAYVAATQTVTVDVAWSVTPGNSLAFEIHAGLEVSEKSGTASGSTTTIVLGAAASSVDDAYTGMVVYLPASAAADQIRKITDYVGATKTATLETAITAIATGDCYAISKGTFGYAAINPLSGIITGTPFRVWLDSDTVENVIEVVMPTGENAFSVQAIQILGYKKSNGVQRQSFKGNVTVTPTYRLVAPSGYTPIFRLRLQNLFRDGGSDGWSAYSYYVEGYSSAATANFDPAAFPPVEIDFQGVGSYPSSKFGTY